MVPSEDGSSLYIRPTIIETSEAYGIKEDGYASSALMYIVTVLNLGKGLYHSAEKPELGLRLDACKDYIRAWPGGTGKYKIGANYGKSTVSWVFEQSLTWSALQGSSISPNRRAITCRYGCMGRKTSFQRQGR